MTSNVQPLNTPFAKQPQDQITTFDTTDLFSTVGRGERYNPDDLVGMKGLRIYARMLNDEQVKAVSQFKRDAMLSRGWHFTYEKGDTSLSEEEQKARIKVFESVCKKLKGSFSDGIEGIAIGAEYGFSMTEKVYGTIEVDGKSQVGINKLLTRDPVTFRFWTDEYGELQQVKQELSAGGREVVIEMDRMIHYVHKPMWDVVYGRSDLRAAYRWWYAKEQLLKLWLLFTERMAGGFAKASRVTDAAPKPNTPEYQSLELALRNIKSLSAIILPPGVEMEMVFPTSGSGDAFEKAIAFCDLAIAKSRLVPNLLGLSHTGQTGAYAQSQTQLEVFFWTLGSDACRVAECVNEQLFRDLGDQNWGDGKYPVFAFKPASQEHVKWVITTWKDMIGAEAVLPTEKDEAFLRELLNMPSREEGDELLAQVKQKLAPDPVGLGPDGKPLQTPGGKGASLPPAPEKKPTVGDKKLDATVAEGIAEIVSAKVLPMLISIFGQHAASSGGPVRGQAPAPEATGSGTVPDDAVPHGELRTATMLQFQSAASRVHFSVIERRTDDVSRYSVGHLANLIARGTSRMLGDNDVMSALLDENQADVAALEFSSLDTARIRDEIKMLLRQSYDLGTSTAMSELNSLDSTKAGARRIVAASLKDKAAGFFEARGHRMAEDITDNSRRIIQQELQNGIKYGKPASEVRATIWDRLVARGLTSRDAARGMETDEAVEKALNELWIDEESVPSYLNTLVRTNTFEALNEARYDAFTDPDMAGFVVAFEYAAVLDSSTTDICEHLNGKTYAADSPVWNEYRPPNHFNCRSILIAITAVDGWDGQEDDPPTVEAQKGFA